MYKKVCHGVLLAMVLVTLTACVGTLVGTAVDTTIEVAKVPFKVAGAAVEVVVPDDKEDKGTGENSND